MAGRTKGRSQEAKGGKGGSPKAGPAAGRARIRPYSPHEVEAEALAFWSEDGTFAKARERVRGREPFYFLDGPPFPSGETHPGTAANKVSKDLLIRYKRMRGLDARDQPGWDMHGLPIEQRTEQLLGLKDKRDITRVVGIERFIDECKRYALRHMGAMERDFTRLGVWMAWDEAYRTITPEYMESVWHALKRVHERGLLYRGKKALSWCPRCATILAKNELEYRTVKDDSIFVKMPVAGRKKEYLIIWTTTPWTLPFNMAIMANPELEYLRFGVGDEVWIMAKTLVHVFMTAVVEKPYTAIETVPGERLVGLKYRHPFYEEMPYHQETRNAYMVVPSTQFVSATAGSGLVHCAPGCGPEDFQVGLELGIPVFNEVDENGFLAGQSGEFCGLRAKVDDQRFVDRLKAKGYIVATTPIEHEYAHCWRCDSPIIYRATDQWFIAVSKIREDILAEIRSLHTVPAEAKDIFVDWISNFSDWCITLQRFWNIPAPIWTCDRCERYEIVGSVAELEERSGSRLEDVHRPQVDPLAWPCQCGGTMRRIPDVLTGWLDSGAAPWASLSYPQREDLFERYFPADFVMEGRDQIRAWFSAMMNFSMAAFGRRPYDAVYWHGFFNDADGRKMSKSKGNFTAVQDIVGRTGGDPARMKFVEWIAPGQDIRFSPKEIEECAKALNVLWNVHNLIIRSARAAKADPMAVDLGSLELDLTDRWLLSAYSSLVADVTERLDAYRLSEVPPLVRRFWLDDLSRWYVQQKRSQLAAGEPATLGVLTHVYLGLLRLAAPIVPMTAEAIYQDLRQEFGLGPGSVHLQDWPEADPSRIDPDAERTMAIVREVTAAVLAAREKVNRGVRWPLKGVDVVTQDGEVVAALSQHGGLVRNVANAWSLSVKRQEDGLVKVVKPDPSRLGPKHKGLAGAVIKALAAADPASVADALATRGSFEVEAGGQRIQVERGEVAVEERVPETMCTVAGGRFSVFVDLTETAEMLSSGLAREVVRHVQALRKEAGLVRSDRIKLSVGVDAAAAAGLAPHRDEVASTCGAVELSFAEPKGRQHVAGFNARGSRVVVGFDRA